MPTYDYECTKCGHTFDEFQSMSDDPLTTCPSCGKKSLRRLIGGGLGIIFKGSGFYATDNRGTSGGNGGKKRESGESKPSTDSGSGGGTDSSGDSKSKSETKVAK